MTTMPIEDEECPQCHHQTYFGEFYTHNFEEKRCCRLCGYRQWTKTVQSYEDGEGRAKLNKQGNLIQRTYRRKGNGAWYRETKWGLGEGGIFLKPTTKETVLDGRNILAQIEEIDLDACWATIWNDERQEVEVVFGMVALEPQPQPSMEFTQEFAELIEHLNNMIFSSDEDDLPDFPEMSIDYDEDPF